MQAQSGYLHPDLEYALRGHGAKAEREVEDVFVMLDQTVTLPSGHVLTPQTHRIHHQFHKHHRHPNEIKAIIKPAFDDPHLSRRLMTLMGELRGFFDHARSIESVVDQVCQMIDAGSMHLSHRREATWSDLRSPISYDVMLVKKAGKAYNDAVDWSHYDEAIDQSAGRSAGNSRKWGDASGETQKRVIDALIASAKAAGLTPREAAHVLAIVRVESGFNPDAAAGTTSAAGLGQFIDKTGEVYGLNDSNRFDIAASASAIVRHYKENKRLAIKRGFKGNELDIAVYKYHHDGPSKDYGGYKISRDEVVPKIEVFLHAIAH